MPTTPRSVSPGSFSPGSTRPGSFSPGRFSLVQRLVLALVPHLAAVLLRLLHRTLRFEVIAEPGATVPTPPGLQVWCLWHRCVLPTACYFRSEFRPAILISRSFDGELVARTAEILGVRTARGSSSRHGGSGLLGLIKAMDGGHPAAFTADGPRGPLYKVKLGAVKLAQLTGYPIGSFYMLPERAWELRSWDRFLIPKPFSRVVVSWGREVEAPRGESPELLEATRLEVEQALEQARMSAERHFARNQESPSAIHMQSP